MFLPLMILIESCAIIFRVNAVSQVIGARHGPTNSLLGRDWECDQYRAGDAREGWTLAVLSPVPCRLGATAT